MQAKFSLSYYDENGNEIVAEVSREFYSEKQKMGFVQSVALMLGVISKGEILGKLELSKEEEEELEKVFLRDIETGPEMENE